MDVFEEVETSESEIDPQQLAATTPATGQAWASGPLGTGPHTVQVRVDGLLIGITKQSTANPLDLSKAVRAEVERINESLPGNMKLAVSYDSSIFIQKSIDSVYTTIAEAIATTGQPAASASMIGTGVPSLWLLMTNTSRSL